MKEILKLLQNEDTVNLGKELLLKKNVKVFHSLKLNGIQMHQNILVDKDDSNDFLSEFIKQDEIAVYEYSNHYSIYIKKVK